MKKLRTLLEKHRTLLLYLVAGGLTTLVDYGAFVLLRLVMPSNTANIISVITAVIFAYFINKLLVFQSKCENFRELLREAFAFFVSRGLTTLFSIAAYPALTLLLGFPELPSKAAVTVAVIVLNYILSVLVVFKKKT